MYFKTNTLVAKSEIMQTRWDNIENMVRGYVFSKRLFFLNLHAQVILNIELTSDSLIHRKKVLNSA